MSHIVTPAGKITYEAFGAGPPLILMAGFGMDTTTWIEQRDLYARFFRVVLLNLRGSGGGDVPDAPYTVADLADDVCVLMDTLRLERAHFGGFSLGGAAGLELAIRYPERLLSLSLHSTWEATQPYPHFGQWVEIRDRIIAYNDPVLNIGTRLVSFFSPEFVDARQDRIDLFVRRAQDNPHPISPKAIAAQARACLDHDVRSRLDRIRVPTLITVGTKDRTTVPKMSEYLHAHIAGSEYVTFEGSGHCTIFQATDEFATVTLGFLMKHTPPEFRSGENNFHAQERQS